LSVSLQIFEGAAADETKSALLRAEWDCNQKIGIPHTQLHWHINPSRLNREIEDYQSFLKEIEIREFDPNAVSANSDEKSEPEWDRGGRFHFAMAARWASEGESAHNENIEHEKLLRWLDGCIRYTLGQFKYLYEKGAID
jgi:hypothetical protein